MDCRYAKNKPTNTVAPAIELFCPAFAQFSSSAFNLNFTVPKNVIRETQNLMALIAAIYPSEEKRVQAIHVLLGKLLGKEIGSVWNTDGTSTDGVIRGSTNVHDAAVLLALADFKNELGGGNLDPSTQAGFTYTRTIAQAGAKVAHYCSSPTFLIVHAGPWLVILGAIFTDRFIVQRLTDFIWIPVHSCHDDAQFLRIARILYALRQALAALDSWYQSIMGDDNLQCYDSKSRPTAPHPRFFPTPTSYPGPNGPIKFNYTQAIDSCVSCVTYLAMTQDFRKIVIKFVDNYGVAAHTVMANEGFAPKLLYYGFIDASQPSLYKDIRMVVMEFVDGKTVDDIEINNELPGSFSEQLKGAISYLHSEGFVFGDLRQPNIMISEGKVMLIDFDWAGKEGEVRYPVALSKSITWPRGVEGLELIEKQHDLDMIDDIVRAVRWK
ncbi:hypothetical protein BDQ12DRAFT_615533 [Crucibulum laeve]|uniref:Protein kinase domain-containing protein n=1 Tax=Crucibulum laeve TaxID=68775 RepID=A0A5C3LK70_9AGAR|nr:hypothetical protein BDQ12DRAFT_615533 [Crucibulum laeve]